MTTRTARVAELAARLSHCSHFNYTDAAFRDSYRDATGNFYSVASPYACASDAQRLFSLAATAQRWAIAECNGIDRHHGNGIFYPTWTEQDQAASDRAKARVLSKAQKIGERYGVTFTVHGDPRGAVLQMHLQTTAEYVQSYGIA